MENSKEEGNTYYYYRDYTDAGVEIGYEDKITEERTLNYRITFGENCINLQNLIDAKTYILTLNESVMKVEKGGAKLAYIFIAKNILDFKVPSSVRVLSCSADIAENIVYAKISAHNSFGGKVEETYKFYEIGGQYYAEKTSHTFSNSVDLEELNTRLQNYVSQNQ